MAAPAISRFAWAQTYPSRPVRIIVGFAPGSSADIIARLMADRCRNGLVRNLSSITVPGTGGNVATEAVVNAAPDGHTLLMVGPSNAINATLYDKLTFNFRRDIAPVAAVARSPNVMLVTHRFQPRRFRDLIALAKANPGKLSMASAGVGTASHLAGELFKMMTGAEMVHVAYRGGAGAYADLIAGGADVYFPALASSIEHIKAGRLRALAVTSRAGTNCRASRPWENLCRAMRPAPGLASARRRNTPAEIVERLNREINAALADPKVSSADCRFRRHGPRRFTGRLRQADRRRNREVGQA